MWALVLQFGTSAIVVVAAGVVLTLCADRLADETGLGRVLVGSVLLAGATSLPELAVDLNAVWLGQPDLAVGDLLGSSLLNLLILATLDSIFRHPRRAFSGEFARHAQTAVMSINLTSLVGIGILSRLSWSLFGLGLFTWIIAFVYVFGLELTYKDLIDQGPGRAVDHRRVPFRSIIGFGGAAAVILLVAPYLVRAAEKLADYSGLGETFVGTTFVALTTSLPELVTAVAAFRMGAPDLALANIFGSNTFNMALIFPLDVFFPGNFLSSVNRAHALTAFCVVTVSSVAVLGQISRRREKNRIWEPSSELIVVMIVAFLYLLYAVRGA